MCLLSLNQYILRDYMLNWYYGILSDQKEEKNCVFDSLVWFYWFSWFYSDSVVCLWICRNKCHNLSLWWTKMEKNGIAIVSVKYFTESEKVEGIEKVEDKW